jgi:hypothetical protein
MTLVCRPTPIVRFMHRSETSSKQLLDRMARLRKHGSVFTHDPSSWKPPKHYLVENVHLNIHNIAQMYKKRKKGDRLMAARHSSPRIHPEAFWRDPGEWIDRSYVAYLSCMLTRQSCLRY